MTEPPTQMECYVVTPGSVMNAAFDAARGNDSALWVIQALAESIIAIGRQPKTCMLSGCGCRMREAKGWRAPAAFVILLPMFPHSGPRTDTAISSPVCRDCYERPDFMARLKETLTTDFDCSSVREATKQ